ncbi:DUF4230 domain-containing protein [Candidatus Dojkabacteria bacterium]|nr:DUF4230 domain-containing protein [Candidatus Dojkabacteria bacterium]
MEDKRGIKSLVITLVVSGLLGMMAGIILGFVICNWSRNSEESGEKTEVTRTTVLEKLQDQAFLVTRTVIADQDVEINVDQGSAWSNFWWGHEIVAASKMQVDIGVDLLEVEKDDISVDESKKEIKIDLPNAEIYNTSVASKIEIETKSGVLKKILDNDKEEDFNLALDSLSQAAEDSVSGDVKLMNDAEDAAVKILQAIFKDTGYKVVAK